MALAAQALEAQKASKPLEQGGALEQVAARIKRVMGLTLELSGAVYRVRLNDLLAAYYFRFAAFRIASSRLSSLSS